MKIEKLNWDTNFFGYQIGKVELEDFHKDQYEVLMEYISKSEMKLIYVYPLDQISRLTLLKYKIPFVGTRVTFEKSNFFSLKDSAFTRSYEASDEYDVIEKLALISGEYSRFKRDGNFLNNEFFYLYTEWIKRSLSKEIATDVIVYKNTSNIKGFVSYKITPDDDIVIGLIAVDPSEQGQGIGSALIQSIENIACRQNKKRVIVSTQLENRQAMAFYHASNYVIKKQQEIFHLWF